MDEQCAVSFQAPLRGKLSWFPSLYAHCTKMANKKKELKISFMSWFVFQAFKAVTKHETDVWPKTNLVWLQHLLWTIQITTGDKICVMLAPFPTKNRKNFPIPAHECHHSCHEGNWSRPVLCVWSCAEEHIIYYLMHKAAQLFCKAFVCTACRWMYSDRYSTSRKMLLLSKAMPQRSY